jgi:hypothetical protein
MNLAPVMDVTDASRDSFIGTRTYGDDPYLVTKMATAFATGLQKADVLPTGKHFPGHGGINADSHLQTPIKRASLAELLGRDLVPFSEAARWPMPPALMVAHVSYPALDPTGTPATFSKPIIGELLRKTLGFDGLVMTDDIEMAGAAAIKDVNERAIRAVEAGADLVMIGWNKSMQRNLRLAIIRAVRRGRIAESRIDESVRRILRAKARYASFGRPALPSPGAISLALRDQGLRTIAERTLRAKFERAEKSLDRSFISEHAGAPVLVFAASESFFNSFKQGAGERETRFFQLDTEGSVNVDRIMRANPGSMGVFYISGSRSAAIANSVATDVAARLVLVNSEARSALASASSFHLVVDVAFRHGSTGRLTSSLLFSPPPHAPASAAPARGPRVPAGENGSPQEPRMTK